MYTYAFFRWTCTRKVMNNKRYPLFVFVLMLALLLSCQKSNYLITRQQSISTPFITLLIARLPFPCKLLQRGNHFYLLYKVINNMQLSKSACLWIASDANCVNGSCWQLPFDETLLTVYFLKSYMHENDISVNIFTLSSCQLMFPCRAFLLKHTLFLFISC